MSELFLNMVIELKIEGSEQEADIEVKKWGPLYVKHKFKKLSRTSFNFFQNISYFSSWFLIVNFPFIWSLSMKLSTSYIFISNHEI